MSVSGLPSDPKKMSKNSLHRRNDSGELDVFEAARYFSGANEDPGLSFSQKLIRQERQTHVQRGPRMSLDMPTRNLIPLGASDKLGTTQRRLTWPLHEDDSKKSRNHVPECHAVDQKKMKENKKSKQPSSPGRRLASFLNSLFNQTTSKKKKPKSVKDFEEESPGGRRKRRSSISHFRFASAAADSKGYADTPTKSYRDYRIISDQQRAATDDLALPQLPKSDKVISLPENNGNFKPTLGNHLYAEKTVRDHAMVEAKSSLRNGVPENGSLGFSEFRKFSDADDDGADTDSSSDLFDLPDFYSSGLPVYASTSIDRIKIGAPISSATT